MWVFTLGRISTTKNMRTELWTSCICRRLKNMWRAARSLSSTMLRQHWPPRLILRFAKSFTLWFAVSSSTWCATSTTQSLTATTITSSSSTVSNSSLRDSKLTKTFSKMCMLSFAISKRSWRPNRPISKLIDLISLKNYFLHHFKMTF